MILVDFMIKFLVITILHLAENILLQKYFGHYSVHGRLLHNVQVTGYLL